MKGVHRQATEAFPVVEISKTLDFSSEGSLNCFEFNNFALHVRRPQRTAVFQMRLYVELVHLYRSIIVATSLKMKVRSTSLQQNNYYDLCVVLGGYSDGCFGGEVCQRREVER